jgi:hypothetical protein
MNMDWKALGYDPVWKDGKMVWIFTGDKKEK